MMLHPIDRLLVKENEKPDWRQYKLPTQSDAGRHPLVYLVLAKMHYTSDHHCTCFMRKGKGRIPVFCPGHLWLQAAL